jgi:hypothetical protein
MPWIILRDGLVDVKRIVIDERHPGWMHAALRGLALNLGLGVANRDVTPKPGDLWVGRVPEKGWGDLSAQAGWVRGADVYRAITQLRQADPIYAVDARFDAPARV